MLHLIALWVWKALPCTRARPVPDFLLFPVPELTLANLMVLPLAMASTLLLMQTDSPRHQALGAVCAAVILGYLGLVAAVLVAVSAKKELLGLRYVELNRQKDLAKDTSVAAPRTAYLACCSARTDNDYNNAMPILLSSSCPRQQQALSHAPVPPAAQPASRTVLRFAPPHASGFWERADAAVQQELRLVYQGAAAGCCGAAPDRSSSITCFAMQEPAVSHAVAACQAASAP